MLKVGVLGAGHLGKIHLRLLQQSEKFELIGFYDPSAEMAEKVSQEFGYRSFSSIESLIEAVDVVDIVTPTLSHYDCAVKSIQAGKHVFLEKPISNTVEEAEHIIKLAREKGVKGQVGHVERFNPAFTAVKNKIENPMFIETHRLAEFNPRGTDVPVVLDLMIHDIDAILSVVKSKVKSVHASGVSVLSQSPDIANARIAFENGCVANITSSRISMKNMRKSRFFQKDAYISVDYLDIVCEVVKIKDAPEEDIKQAVSIYEKGGEDSLWKFLGTKDWGVIKTGFSPWRISMPNLQIDEPSWTMVRGAGYLMSRDSKEMPWEGRNNFFQTFSPLWDFRIEFFLYQWDNCNGFLQKE